MALRAKDPMHELLLALPPKMRKLFLEFDKAAKVWGWEEDQGLRNVDVARRRYESSRRRMLRKLIALCEIAREPLVVEHGTNSNTNRKS